MRFKAAWSSTYLHNDSWTVFNVLSSVYSPCSNKGMEHLYSMKCKNKVPLYDLLLEMLDAHRLHRPDRPAESWSQTDREPAYSSTATATNDDNNNNNSSSGSRAGHEGPNKPPIGPGVLQYGGPRSDCTHILWGRSLTSYSWSGFYRWCTDRMVFSRER